MTDVPPRPPRRLLRLLVGAVVVGASSLSLAGVASAAPVTIGFTAQASPSGFPVGVAISDSVNISYGLNPTGTLTFKLFGPGATTCTGTPLFAATKPVSGNGYYASDSYTTTRAGAYSWLAAYSGDANHSPATTVCNALTQTVHVAKRTLILGGVAASPSGGATLTDTATLSQGAGSAGPTGTLTFSLYGPNNLICAGAPIFTSSKPVAGNGSYVSDPFTATATGTYRWTVRYGGDADNNVAQTMCIDAGQAVSVTTVAPSQTTRFVNKAYQDLLGRAPTAAESLLAVPVLELGGDRFGFALSLTSSSEFRRAAIAGEYLEYLGRAVDAPALNAVLDLLAQGLPFEIVTTVVVSSDEFYAMNGSTPGGYVDAVYRMILGTAPDTASRNHWVKYLNDGGHRNYFAWVVSTSHAAHVHLVETTYRRLLDRPADAFGLDYWTRQLDAGLGRDYLFAYFVASPDYLSKV